jgi:hypothetical protein
MSSPLLSSFPLNSPFAPSSPLAPAPVPLKLSVSPSEGSMATNHESIDSSTPVRVSMEDMERMQYPSSSGFSMNSGRGGEGGARSSAGSSFSGFGVKMRGSASSPGPETTTFQQRMEAGGKARPYSYQDGEEEVLGEPEDRHGMTPLSRTDTASTSRSRSGSLKSAFKDGWRSVSGLISSPSKSTFSPPRQPQPPLPSLANPARDPSAPPTPRTYRFESAPSFPSPSGTTGLFPTSPSLQTTLLPAPKVVRRSASESQQPPAFPSSPSLPNSATTSEFGTKLAFPPSYSPDLDQKLSSPKGGFSGSTGRKRFKTPFSSGSLFGGGDRRGGDSSSSFSLPSSRSVSNPIKISSPDPSSFHSIGSAPSFPSIPAHDRRRSDTSSISPRPNASSFSPSFPTRSSISQHSRRSPSAGGGPGSRPFSPTSSPNPMGITNTPNAMASPKTLRRKPVPSVDSVRGDRESMRSETSFRSFDEIARGEGTGGVVPPVPNVPSKSGSERSFVAVVGGNGRPPVPVKAGGGRGTADDDEEDPLA